MKFFCNFLSAHFWIVLLNRCRACDTFSSLKTFRPWCCLKCLSEVIAWNKFASPENVKCQQYKQTFFISSRTVTWAARKNWFYVFCIASRRIISPGYFFNFSPKSWSGFYQNQMWFFFSVVRERHVSLIAWHFSLSRTAAHDHYKSSWIELFI